jgi:hypothetical protein
MSRVGWAALLVKGALPLSTSGPSDELLWIQPLCAFWKLQNCAQPGTRG